MFPKPFVGIEGASLMGILTGLNKGGELVWGILEDSNEWLLEFSPNWALLKLSLVVSIGLEFFETLDSESELSVWILHNGLSVQCTSFEGGLSEVFWISYLGEEAKDWMETVVFFVRRWCHNIRLLAQKYLL